MNKFLVSAWPKDFETGLNIVPPGDFTTFSEYPNSNQPARVRKLPVLRGLFDSKGFDLDPSLPTYIGWSVLPLARTYAIAFRVQRGDNMLYWLANPADPLVWAALDKWAVADAMVLAAEFEDGPALLVPRDFNLKSPIFNRLREAQKLDGYTMAWVTDATRMLASGGLKAIASTDLPTYPKLAHVQGCMVRTEHTGGVALMLNDKAPGPDGPVADAIEALVKAMTRPEQPRH